MAATLKTAVVLDYGTGGIGKSCHGSCISLSTCSGVIDTDESLWTKMPEKEENTGSLLEPELWSFKRQDWGEHEMEDVKKESLYISLDKVEGSSSLLKDKNEAHSRGVISVSKGFQKRDIGSTIAAKLDTLNVPYSVEHTCQEKLEQNKGTGSGAVIQGCLYQTTDCKDVKETNSLNRTLSKGHGQAKSDDQCVAESIGTGLKKQKVRFQAEIPSIATIQPVSSCDIRKSFQMATLQAIIKPKDVIHAVGQKLFWKARKAILRQQEIFTDQVFELHKLIEVQRLLAKLPSTLMEDRMPSPKASPGALCSAKGKSQKQHAVSIKEHDEQTTGPGHGKDEGHEQRLLQNPETDQDAGADVQQTKSRSAASLSRNCLTEGQWGGSSQGMSTWGYPMGSINRPVLYPQPSVCPFPPASGTYAVRPGPPITPFPFSFYAPGPEIVAPYFGFYNQWPNSIMHGSGFPPLSNDWSIMSHPSQAPLASHSGKPRPTTSVPSIILKAEASSHSGNLAAGPLPYRPRQAMTTAEATIVPAEAAGSAATTSLLTRQDFTARKPAGACDVDQGISVPNSSIDNKCVHEDGASVSMAGREGATDMERSYQKNALDLFPLQPLNNAEGAEDEVGCGRIIKAVPRSALAASESAAVILRSLQRERQR